MRKRFLANAGWLACVIILVGILQPFSLPQAHAQAGVSMSVVSFRGHTTIDSKKAEKSYSGYGEAKNTSTHGAKSLTGKATLFWKGVSIAVTTLYFPTTLAQSGETIPFYLGTDINFLLDVDDVKYEFDGQTTDANYIPKMVFEESFKGQPVSFYSYRVSGKVRNVGQDVIEKPDSIMVFYDQNGKIIDYDEKTVYSTVGDSGAIYPKVPNPLLNPGWGVNNVYYCPYCDVPASSYKVIFRGTPIPQESQLLVTSNVTLGKGDYEKVPAVTGSVSNPTDRTIQTTMLVITAYDTNGKVMEVSQDFFHKVVGGNYVAETLGPHESKTFATRIELYGTDGTPARVEVLAVSYDRFPLSSAPPPAPAPTTPAISPTPVPAGTTCQTFQETGKTVCGQFLAYWQTHGGLAQQGYPITGELQEPSLTDGKTYTVQYFERAVFELHSENQAPNDVLLQLLGVFRYQKKYPNGAPAQLKPISSAQGFPETGYFVGGLFLDYWKTHGGLAQQGFPISNEFQEVSELDGKTYTVQYFERAVFEIHPENAAPNNVLLSQLGTFQDRERHGPR